MKALIWKDLRIFLDVFWAGIALLAASYLLAALLVYSDTKLAFDWGEVIAGGASLTRFSSLLICALLGAYAFAKENEDRTVLFLTAMPAKRAHIVISKLIVACTMVAALWAVSMTIMTVGLRAMGWSWDTIQSVFRAMIDYFAMSAMAFGAAWALSHFIDSAVGAAFAGLMTLAPVCLAQLVYNRHFRIEGQPFFHPVTVGLMFVAAVVGVGVGEAIFMRGGIATEAVGARIRLPWKRSVPSHYIPGRKAGQFHALVWKDFRLLRLSLVVGVAILALPYLIAIGGSGMLAYLRTAAVVSTALSVLVFTFWGGQIMSAEAASGTAKFLAHLPARAYTGIGSRFFVAFTPVAVITLINVAMLIAVNNAMPGEARFDASLEWAAWVEAPHIVMGLALSNGAVAAFALAWFASAHYGRPAVAIVLGVLAAPLSVAVWAALGAYFGETPAAPSPLEFVCLFSGGVTILVAILLLLGSRIAVNLRPYET